MTTQQDLAVFSRDRNHPKGAYNYDEIWPQLPLIKTQKKTIAITKVIDSIIPKKEMAFLHFLLIQCRLSHQDTAELFFEDVRLPASALIGK